MNKPRSIEYSRYLDAYYRSFGGPRRSKRRRFSLHPTTAPLLKLLDSMTNLAASKDSETRLKEWNPFSQRIFFGLARESDVSPIIEDLDIGLNGAVRFNTLTHEAMHIYLWEPFFCGFGQRPTAKQFVDLALRFEGFCFWHSDIVLTKLLRETYADGELILKNRVVSHTAFHPYRVFKALGITNPIDILKVYIDAFAGYHTVLAKNKNEIFTRELFLRFSAFFIDTQKPATGMYRALVDISYYDEFQTRFCRIDGLPSLLPRNLLEFDSLNRPTEYCLEFEARALPFVDKMSRAELERVSLRRSIQSRAYYAFCMRYAFKQDLVFSLKVKTQTKAIRLKILSNLEIYLNRLEQTLRDLAAGATSSAIEDDVERIGAYYDRAIRSPIKSQQLWMKQRALLTPYLAVPGSLFGVYNPKSPLNLRSRRLLTDRAFLFARKVLEITTDLTTQATLLEAMSRLASANAEGVRSEIEKRNWLRDFNHLVSLPQMLEHWSIPLDAIDPAKNRFREILFAYP